MLEKLLDKIRESYTLTESYDALRRFEASGMTFEAHAYTAQGLGHIGVMTAEGQAELETLIVNPFSVDAPVISFDYMRVMSQVILVAEMYDTLLGDSFHTEGMLPAAGGQDTASGETREYWYTPLIIPPTLSLRGALQDAIRFDATAERFLDAYLTAARAAETCDPVSKCRKAAVYTEGLLKHGGPATDPVKAAMGEQWTAELFGQTLFGTGEIRCGC